MNPIKKIIIFYFSGTGNSKRVGQWFVEFAMEKGISCKLADITKENDTTLKAIDPDCMIGIVSPIHGFNYPKIMLDFIRRFPKGKSRIVLMNTRAGVKVGKMVTPGLTGIAFMLSSLILKRKGYKIIGQIPFDMPSNWISIHPAIREKSAQFIFDKNRYRVKKHFEKIYAGKSDFASRKDIIQDVLISPVSFAYYLIGRFFLAKSYYASYKCTNCNLCIKQCPVNAIKKVNGRPFWTFKCESCMKCMNNCPVDAIETPHGLWAIVIYLTSIVCTYLFYNLLPEAIQFWIVKFFLFNIILIAYVWALYRIQQLELKNRIIAKIISLTSLTHYKFWGRYKRKKKVV
ncbi:MAG TPA: hypothetical protein DDW85_09735 [Porphyromonadaceae bacterium]|nr:hypothetical protein [Porphyromonadaceae bacterium]